jgi:hypothetical protein
MMEKMKTAEASFVSAAEWVRRLAKETAAFEVAKVVDAQQEHDDGKSMEWDHVITISTKTDHLHVDLFVETRRQLLPSTALGVFQRLRWVPPDGILLICAPYISPRVAELCREHSVSYLDGVGNCRITASGLFINVSGRPNRPTSPKANVDPFSRKSSRVVRLLLTHPEQGWQVQQLAQQADVSMGLASKVKNALLEEAYMEERDRLLYLRDPARLLQGWVVRHRPHVKSLQLFTISRPSETESRISEWCRTNEITYALTQLSAAWRYSPFVRYDKCVVYVDKRIESGTNLKSLLSHIDAREVDSGANCTLWITDDPAVFNQARKIGDVTVVSPLQLYLDLKALAGRGGDAAQEILEKQLPMLVPDSDSGTKHSHRRAT